MEAAFNAESAKGRTITVSSVRALLLHAEFDTCILVVGDAATDVWSIRAGHCPSHNRSVRFRPTGVLRSRLCVCVCVCARARVLGA